QVDDRATELLPFAGVRRRVVEGGLAETDRAVRGAGPAAVERGERDLETPALRTQNAVRRNARAVEHDLSHGRRAQAHRLLRRLRHDAGGVTADEQAGAAAGARAAGADEHVVEVGPAGVGDPRLGAVDDVLVAL